MLPMLHMSFFLVFFYECCSIYRIDSSLNNLLAKNVKIKVLRNIILPALLNMYEACLVPLREDYRISVLTLQNGVTSTARHSENITCRGVTSTARVIAKTSPVVE